MADPLYELLAPYFDSPSPPNIQDPVTAQYLNRLSSLSLDSLTTTEPQALAQASQSTSLSLQSLSLRSHGAIIASADHLSSLSSTLIEVASAAEKLKNGIPLLDERVLAFSTKYSRSAENEVLDRRKKALVMARNVDRLSDILDLPTLLSSAISSSSAQEASSTINYASALDLHSHIKRLHLLYRDSPLIDSIYKQSEDAMQQMTTSLIASLRSPNIKLAAAMRTIGWLRRVAPDLDGPPTGQQSSSSNREGALGALFLVCRLSTLTSMLSALDPLRELADQESAALHHRRKDATPKSSNGAWSGGQQTERYLKRYIEIFREHSFAIISMYKSIFPSSSSSSSDHSTDLIKSLNLKNTSSSPPLTTSNPPQTPSPPSPPPPPPPALSTFTPHLVGLLISTLKRYLPNVRDRSSRESLLTQVLYSAGSLGRLGGDFSLMLALLEEGDGRDERDDDDDDDDGRSEGEGIVGGGRMKAEWVEVMKKHRILAGKLELMARGSSQLANTVT
jgi:hypothetical protein